MIIQNLKVMSVVYLQLHRGGEIPHSYYLSNNQPVARENFESLSVSAGSKKLVKFQVGVVNSILRSVFMFQLNLIYKKSLINVKKVSSSWEFMTDAGDIAFRVFTKDAELLPTNKVESHLVMEEGEICCESKGECKASSRAKYKYCLKISISINQIYLSSTTPSACSSRKRFAT